MRPKRWSLSSVITKASLTNNQGYRIAPEEVENSILAADGSVQGASVQVSPDGLSLIAIVMPDTCRADLVQSKVREMLPSQMHPSAILPVKSLPVTSSGKIDHKWIRDHLGSYMRGAPKVAEKPSGSTKDCRYSCHQADRNLEVEEFISKAWQEEIGLFETPSIDVNFFDIGGHR